MDKKKQTHGGKRQGAGRKKNEGDTAGVKFPVYMHKGLVEKLDAHAKNEGLSRSRAITRIVQEKLEKPG